MKTMHAMPVMLGVLAILAIAYRYYSAFLAARVAALDDSRVTPAHRLSDGQNFDPTNRWVLFGHHFAAISGAGPLALPYVTIIPRGRKQSRLGRNVVLPTESYTTCIPLARAVKSSLV